MEPNTTFPSASSTHPSILEQGLPSVLAAETHLSPASLLLQPSPDLMSEWFSSSMSPAMEHAASQPVFSPSFSALGEVHMTGGEGDFFSQQETPETTEIPMVLGGQQPWQPSSTVSVNSGAVPAFPSEGAAIFAGQPALPEPNVVSTWQSEMPLLLELQSGCGLPLPSIGGGGVGSAIASSVYDLAPLPESLDIPSMEEESLYNMSSTVDVSWSMGDGSSSMSFQQDVTMGAPAAPVQPITPPLFQGVGSFMSSPQDMTMTMQATGDMGAQALPMTPSLSQGVGSFVSSQQDMTIGATPLLTPSLLLGVGSFISSEQDLTTIGAMGAPALPMTCPLSQGPSNFVQPTSDVEFTPAPAGFQAPLLPVKEEPIDNTAIRMEPVFISLDDEEDELYHQDDIANPLPHSMPADNPTGNVLSLSSKLKLLEQLYNIKSMSTGASKSYVMPPMPLSTSSSRASAGITLSSSTSTRASASNTLSSLTRAGVRSNMQVAHINVNGVLFTDAEMEILRKDKNMQELVATDIKKVKRTIANRICSARRHAFKEKHTLELERQAEALHNKWKEVSMQLQVRQVQYAELKENNRKMSMMVQELERQDMLKDALTEALQAQIQALTLVNQHTTLQTNPRNDDWSNQ